MTRDFLRQKIADWETHRTVSHASDAVGAAITLQRENEVSDAAHFLLQTDRNVSVSARELAKRALEVPSTTEHSRILVPTQMDRSTLGAQIRTHREILRSEPRDAISWVELSRLYVTLGMPKQADASMDVAVHLASNNRFVLRAASRLWVHIGEKDKAYDTLVRAASTAYDPWLLAAELAVGHLTNRRAKRVRKARQMLSEGHFSPTHTSELASAVGTLELGSGSNKRARRLFEQSLVDPTENSVAQAVWAERRHSLVNIASVTQDMPTAFEAESWQYYENSEWNKALERCKLWQFDQPFSTGPGWHGTFTAAVAMQDYNLGVWFAERGLEANPNDFTLLNNLVFSLINRGDLDRAQLRLKKIEARELSSRQKAVLKATTGLLEYRRGNIEGGRRLYLDARTIAQQYKGTSLLALATMFHAIEEVSIGAEGCDELKADAMGLLKQQKRDKVFRVLETRLADQKPGSRWLSRP